MIEAYAISVAAKLEDGVTPSLLRIIDALSTANAAMLEFAANVRKLSTGGLSVARNLDKASAAATALGDSTAALTRASYVLDTMAASSADVARNLGAAKAEAAGMGRGGAGLALRASGGTRRSGDGIAGRASKEATIGTVGLIGYGIYENARLSDILTRAVMTDGTPAAQQESAIADYRSRIMREASRYGYSAHGLADFASAYLSASRLLRGMPQGERMGIVDTILPYAAQEAFLKKISLNESLSAFIGAAHMAGAYEQKDIAHMLPALISTSMATNASMSRIENSAGYAVPILRTGLDIDPAKVFTMLAIMQRAGIQNSKSGTWLADLFMNAIPGNFGAGLFHNTKQAQALRHLGLLDAHNHLTYLDKTGNLDPLKLITQLATGLAHLPPIERAADMKQAFGTQGARAAALLSDPKVRAMIPLLTAAAGALESPTAARDQALKDNPAAKAHQVITNAQLAITNATATFMGPVNAALSTLEPATAGSADFAKGHPLGATLLGAGVAFGSLLIGKSMWSLSKLIAKGSGTLIEKLVISAAEKVTGAEIAGSAMEFLGAGAGVIASLGVALAGAAGYALGSALNWALDQATKKITDGKESNLGGWLYDVTHPTSKKRAPLAEQMRERLGAGATKNWGGISAGAISQAAQWAQMPGTSAPNVHVKVQIDGQDVRTRITKDMLPNHSRGSTNFNPAVIPLSPGMTVAPGM